MKELIINADDFGLSTGANRAIIKAWREGILTSTSLMVTGEAFEEAVSLARENPGLQVAGGRSSSAQAGAAVPRHNASDRQRMMNARLRCMAPIPPDGCWDAGLRRGRRKAQYTCEYTSGASRAHSQASPYRYIE